MLCDRFHVTVALLVNRPYPITYPLEKLNPVLSVLPPSSGEKFCELPAECEYVKFSLMLCRSAGGAFLLCPPPPPPPPPPRPPNPPPPRPPLPGAAPKLRLNRAEICSECVVAVVFV